MGTKTLSQPRRIGVFGGTFDPIHNAHIEIARAALTAGDLDVVLFMVAARPPHKTGETYATPMQRLAMVRAAVANEPEMEASAIELDREGPSYTFETLGVLHAEYPEAELFLILGYDSLVDLSGWREPDKILERARLLVVARPGRKQDVPEELNGQYEIVPFDETDLSSTEIRSRIAQGVSADDAIPRPVLDVIHKEGLYDVGVTDRARG